MLHVKRPVDPTTLGFDVDCDTRATGGRWFPIAHRTLYGSFHRSMSMADLIPDGYLFGTFSGGAGSVGLLTAKHAVSLWSGDDRVAVAWSHSNDGRKSTFAASGLLLSTQCGEAFVPGRSHRFVHTVNNTARRITSVTVAAAVDSAAEAFERAAYLLSRRAKTSSGLAALLRMAGVDLPWAGVKRSRDVWDEACRRNGGGNGLDLLAAAWAAHETCSLSEQPKRAVKTFEAVRSLFVRG